MEFFEKKDEEVKVVPIEVGMIFHYYQIADAAKDAEEMASVGIKTKLHTYPDGFCKAAIEILEVPDETNEST